MSIGRVKDSGGRRLEFNHVTYLRREVSLNKMRQSSNKFSVKTNLFTLKGEGRGRIIFGDVGQNYVEELDLLEMGANYEWNIKEAKHQHCKTKNCLKGIYRIM